MQAIGTRVNGNQAKNETVKLIKFYFTGLYCSIGGYSIGDSITMLIFQLHF